MSRTLPPTFSLTITNDDSLAQSSKSLDGLIKEQFERCRRHGGILRNDPLESNVLRKRLESGGDDNGGGGNSRLGLIAEYEPSLFAHKRAATITAAATATEEAAATTSTTTATATTTSDDGSSNKKRKTTTTMMIDMAEPFDSTKFNFTKVGKEEILVTIRDDHGVGGGGNNQATDKGAGSDHRHHHDHHPLLINVSPLMYGHGLLIPYTKKGLPQQLTYESIGLAIKLILATTTTTTTTTSSSDAGGGEFCIGFNSLGAFSSVNHLHLHILFPGELDHETRLGTSTSGTKVQQPPLMNGSKDFPIAHAPIKETVTMSYTSNSSRNNQQGNCNGGRDCRSRSRSGSCCRVDLLDWMVSCFSFQQQQQPVEGEEEEEEEGEDNNKNQQDKPRNDSSTRNNSTTSYQPLQEAVDRFVRFLHTQRIPHNVLFLRQNNTTATTTTTIGGRRSDGKTHGGNVAPDDNRISPLPLRVVVIPRKHQYYFDSKIHGFNAALGEISGMLVAKTKERFDSFQREETIRDIMKQYVDCDPNVLARILSELKQTNNGTKKMTTMMTTTTTTTKV